MIDRPLAEIAFNNKMPDEIVLWCEEHATFTHRDRNEYMFWIPPYLGHENYLTRHYGEEIPTVIKELLVKIITDRADKKDSGFLLIAFLKQG